MLLSSFDFLESLRKADVFACAYGEYHSTDLGMPLPTVSLVGTDEKAFRDAFKEFKRWGGEEDGDVVDLHFVFLQEGGYLLGIGPEPVRMSHRLRGYDRVLISLHCGGTWAKKFDSRHPMLEWLAEYNRALLSPLFFSAAVHPKADDPSALRPDLVRPIADLMPILKFEASFAREQDVVERSPQWALLQIHRSGGDESTDSGTDDVQKPPEDVLGDPKSFRERRGEMLSRHFPVLLSRLRQSQAHAACLEQLASRGVRPWQIEQAVCNLALSRSVCGCQHYATMSADDFRDQVIPALRSRFEQADGQCDEPALSPDAVRQQIVLDSVALLNHFSITQNGTDVETLTKQLEQEGFLDA